VEPVLDSRYQLRQRLGQGGMGAVYKARHLFLKTTHAIKVILPDLVGNDPELAKRFRQEAMAAAAIRHHNVIAVTDYGVVNGTMPFLVMEFIQGKSLQDILTEEGRFAPRRALEFMTAIGGGVGAAHRRGIVHRDLKPLNVMIEDELPLNEAVKVLDFGLAKIRSGELLGSFVAAKTTGIMGSPFYMAPEQWSDEEPDQRADIYSLGIILYQMLAGDVPFKGPSVPSIMKKHLMDAPPPFAEKGAPVSSRVEGVVCRALEKEPEKRPQTVEEFVRELREAVTADYNSRPPVRPFMPDQQANTLISESPDEQLAGTISDAAINEAQNEQAVLEAARREAEVRRRQEEEAARWQADMERQRAEAEAQQRAEQEAAALRAAEEERQRREEQQRREAEEAARQAEEERLKREAEEAARQAEEERQRKVEEERLRQEAEARKQAEEEAARKLAEEEARQRAEEEAAARLQAEEEAAARRRAEEEQHRQEEAARLRIEEETARRAEEERQHKEREEAKRLAAEKARQLEEEEERRRKDEAEAQLAAEEAARLFEEKRQAEEAARQAEEAQREREAKESARKAAAEQRRQQAEARRQDAKARKRADAEARKRAEEEETRKRAEEEAAHRQAEEEAAARLRAEEEQRQREDAASALAAAAAARAAEAEKQLREEDEAQAAQLRSEAAERFAQAADEPAAAIDEPAAPAPSEPERPAQEQPIGSTSYPPPVTHLAEESLQQAEGTLRQQPFTATDSVAPEPSPFQDSAIFDRPPAKRSALMLIIGLVGALLLVGVLGAGFYFKMQPRAEVAQTNPNQPNPPAPSPARDMILIPGGKFKMGRDDVVKSDDYEILQYPAHEVTVESFYIDKTEVTNAEYAKFVDEMGYPVPVGKEGPDWQPWEGNKPPAGQELWPVRNVSVEDTKAFAAWLSKRDGVTYRLPTEEEWEYAARGGSKNYLYPWGNEWLDGYANVGAMNIRTDAPKPVGSAPQNASPFGVLDMLGNVWEWTSSEPSIYPGNNEMENPKKPGRVVRRGGGYTYVGQRNQAAIPATFRDFLLASTKANTIGFRLVRAGS
jgi:serine/threonine protein kinase/formylglycine-generating enzyme required for sulfatase activity